MRIFTAAGLVLFLAAACDDSTATVASYDMLWRDNGTNSSTPDGHLEPDTKGPDRGIDAGPTDAISDAMDPTDTSGDGIPVDAPADIVSDAAPADIISDAAPLTFTGTGLFHEHLGPGALDVTTLVAGGATPLICAFYTGPGMGTGSQGGLVQLDGCSFSTAFEADDLPGAYGVIIVVKDQIGQQVEIPIVARNGSCNTAVGSITPPEYPIKVHSPPGAALDYTLSLTDVDALCSDASCEECPVCVVSAAGTKAPLALAPGLDCASPGDLCLDIGTLEGMQSCPSVVSWTTGMHVKAHTPVRADGMPGWITLHVEIDYSGTVTTSPACGNKKWSCHLEVLEAP